MNKKQIKLIEKLIGRKLLKFEKRSLTMMFNKHKKRRKNNIKINSENQLL